MKKSILLAILWLALGHTSFAHATLSFTATPALSLYDIGTITAVDSSGQQVSYASATPTVCSVNENSGLVTALATGDCTITATAGTVQTTQAIPITAPSSVTVPGAPSGVTATLGDTDNSVMVNIGGVVSGGSPIAGFTVSSTPAGIDVTGFPSFPITLTCPASCAGYAFTVKVTNAIGTGASSFLTDVITDFKVVETFYEPETQPKNSIFIGAFALNSTTGTVSNLKGILSESMSGDPIAYPNDNMAWVTLNNQLASWHDATLGGTFAVAFRNANTKTFWTGLGGDGWSPQAGIAVGGVYYGFPKAANNPGSAYALIFVPDNPLAALTQAQIDKLAYADCVPLSGPGGYNGGGMMGAVCMTGTSAAGYGAIGTMGGYPVSQVTTKAKTRSYIIDTSGPTGTITVSGGMTRTNGSTVTLNLSASDASGISQMQFSDDGTNWSAAENYSATKTWPLPSGDGLKTIYVRFMDGAGNWSNAFTTTVTLDTAAPTTTASPAGGIFGEIQNVTLTASETSTIYYTTNGIDPTESSGAYSAPIPISATTTLKYFARDQAGNMEAVKTQRYIIDRSGPTGTIAISGGGTRTNGITVTLDLSASDAMSGISQMQLSDDGTNWSNPEAYSTSKSWTLPVGDGVKTIYVKFRDTVGNWSNAFTTTVTLVTGDLNSDGKVDLSDAILIMQAISGAATDRPISKAADLNGDGKIGMAEVIYILQKAAGMR